MLDAVACCICTDSKPMNRHNCGNSLIRLSEQSASAARFKRIQRTERVKYIARMWISWTGLRRVVHKLSTGFTIDLFSNDLFDDVCRFIYWDVSFDRFKDYISDLLLIIAHWWPHPVPLKWIGVDVHIRSIVTRQYGHPGGVKSASKSALIGLIVLHTGHLNS